MDVQLFRNTVNIIQSNHFINWVADRPTKNENHFVRAITSGSLVFNDSYSASGLTLDNFYHNYREGKLSFSVNGEEITILNNLSETVTTPIFCPLTLVVESRIEQHARETKPISENLFIKRLTDELGFVDEKELFRTLKNANEDSEYEQIFNTSSFTFLKCFKSYSTKEFTVAHELLGVFEMIFSRSLEIKTWKTNPMNTYLKTGYFPLFKNETIDEYRNFILKR